MSLEIRLTSRARRDIQSITDYSMEVWGVDQTAQYTRGLTEVFERIREMPGIGRLRSDLGGGMRSVNYQRHCIFYHPEPTFLTVAAVLHQSQDVNKHLGPLR